MKEETLDNIGQDLNKECVQGAKTESFDDD
jgi:hypothetical protein